MAGHDIFISYAHADDEPPMGLDRGWITTFVDELRKILRRRLGGGGADIWMDHQLAANAVVQPTLLDMVRSSRTLVLFMSPGYLASPWCAGEIGGFLDRYAAEGATERVFMVELDQLDRSLWHPRLQNLSAIPLWEKGFDDLAPRLLGYPRPKPDEDSPYWLRLNELAHLLSGRLLHDRQAGAPAAASAPVAAPTVTAPAATPVSATAPVVWVAEPTDDLFDAWSMLAAALRQAGVQLRPAALGNYPLASGQAYLEALQQDLAQAKLLVQLLGPFAGRRPGAAQGENLSISQLQAKAAAESGLPFLQWRDPALLPESLSDVGQKQLLLGAQASGLEAFRQRVLDTLAQLQAPPPPPQPAVGDDTSLAICITGGVKDQALCEEVSQILADLGQSPLNSPPAPDPGESPADFRRQCDELLGMSEGVILVYGQESRAWVQGQFLRVKKLLAQQKTGLWGALLDGPPSAKQALGLASPGLMPLDCRSGPSPETIKRFVDSLKGGAHV